MDQTAEACRWMRVEKGLSVRDIANRLNITEGAVRKALSRAGATAQQVHRSNSPRELNKLSLQDKLTKIEEERQAGVITAQQEIAQKAAVNRQLRQLDKDLEQDEYKAKIKALRQQALLYAEGTKDRRDYNRQIEVLEAQHNQRMRLIDRQHRIAERRDEQAAIQQKRQAMSGIAQTWGDQLARMITLQQGFAATVRGLWDGLVGVFQQAIARMIQQWILGLLVKETASKSSHAKEIMLEAKKAAAGAYSSVVKIPIIGPVLAPIAAATAFAAVAAFSAKGGYDVPALAGPGIDGKGGQMGVVHPREMILPADLADKIRGGGIGGSQLHLHGTIIQNPREIERWFKTQRGGVGAAGKAYARQGGR